MNQIRHHQENRCLTLYLQGELDHHQAQIVSSQIRQLVDENLPRKLILDLSGLTFTDSSGIAVLLRASRAMKELEGSLDIIQVPPQPLRLFQTAGLEKILSFGEMSEIK